MSISHLKKGTGSIIIDTLMASACILGSKIGTYHTFSHIQMHFLAKYINRILLLALSLLSPYPLHVIYDLLDKSLKGYSLLSLWPYVLI